MINRRNFLKKGAVLSTWSFLPSMIHEDKNKTTSKKLGLQIHSVRPQLLLDFEGTLKKIADIGFKNIEAYGLDASGLFIEKIKPLVYKKTVNNLGMNLLSTHVNYFDYENSEKVVKTTSATNTVTRPSVELEITTIDLSYTVGGATIGISNSEHSNDSYTAGDDTTETIVALSLAF